MASRCSATLARCLLATRPALRAKPFISTYLPQRGFASVNEASSVHDKSANASPPLENNGATPAPYAKGESVGDKSFRDYIAGRVFIVTGAGGRGRGLGLVMAEGLVEAGGMVHCIDYQPRPDEAFDEVKQRVDQKLNGGLEYHSVDVTDTDKLESVIKSIAAERKQLNGLIAAAGVQNPKPALEYPVNEVKQMLDVNYTGVFVAARACANEMYRYKVKDGSICLVASMSGSIANKGLITPVYNSSKGAVVQLARSLAMEWGRTRSDKSGGIRVNSLSPGHIRTPMVNKNFEDGDLSEPDIAERAMLGRISEPEEFKATGLFLMSKASSFITGSNLLVDGGATAW